MPKKIKLLIGWRVLAANRRVYFGNTHTDINTRAFTLFAASSIQHLLAAKILMNFFSRRRRKKPSLVRFDFALLSGYTCREPTTWANTLENYLLHGAINRTALTHVSMIVHRHSLWQQKVCVCVCALSHSKFMDSHSRFVRSFQVFNVQCWILGALLSTAHRHTHSILAALASAVI